MNKPLNDQKTEDLVRDLVRASQADEQLMDDVATSPTVWWSVKRGIEAQKAKQPWPPSKLFWRWLAVGLSATAAATLLVAVLILDRPSSVVGDEQAQVTASSDPAAPQIAQSVDEHPTPSQVVTSEHLQNVIHTTQRVRTEHKQPIATSQHTKATATSGTDAEIRSDFIALNYASTPESGQIVRVKVPKSMMVTTGLVQHVEKPTELVDAEVVVGDDGMTQAIRFISKGQ